MNAGASPLRAHRDLVLVPTLNEVEGAPSLVRAVRSNVQAADILLIDDASPDGTASAIRALGDPQVHVLERHGASGLGPSYLDGYRWGLERGYDRFIQMDADFSHAPADVPRLLSALEQGADVAIGSRYIAGGRVEGWGAVRRSLSKGGSIYSRTILGHPVHDMTSGFKALSRRAVEALDLPTIQSTGYAFQVEVNHRAHVRGLRIVEVPVVFVDRRAGASKMSGHIVAEAIWRVWAMRFTRRR